MARALDAYSGGPLAGRWARSIVGIGPIIAAGLLAHIDIKQAPTVGHVWRFAGLDPTLKWTTKTKRPWNGALKRLCWLIGESFTKVSNNPGDIYGKIIRDDHAASSALTRIHFTSVTDADTETIAALVKPPSDRGR